MSNLLSPVPREVLLETADELLAGTKYMNGTVDIPSELHDIYTPAYIREGRLLATGMLPEDTLKLIRDESGEKIHAKFQAQDEAAAARKARPIKRILMDFLRQEQPIPIDPHHFIPDISGNITKRSRMKNMNLIDDQALVTRVWVHQWDFSGELKIGEHQVTVNPSASALLVGKMELLSDQKDSIGNVTYLSLPYAEDVYEHILKGSPAMSSFNIPTTPFTNEPAHPSVVMQRIMLALIKSSQR